MSDKKVNTNAASAGDNATLGNDYAVGSVPYSERRGFYGTAAVWVGWCISLSAFLS